MYFALQVVYIDVSSYVRVIVICMAGTVIRKRGIVGSWGSVVVKALRY